jgi:hypothetical protein
VASDASPFLNVIYKIHKALETKARIGARGKKKGKKKERKKERKKEIKQRVKSGNLNTHSKEIILWSVSCT